MANLVDLMATQPGKHSAPGILFLKEPIIGFGEMFSAESCMCGIGALKKPSPNALPSAPPASENTKTAKAAKTINSNL